MIANPGQADEVRTACSGAVEAVEFFGVDDSCIRDSGSAADLLIEDLWTKTASARSRGRRWMVVRVVANVAVHRVRVEGGGRQERRCVTRSPARQDVTAAGTLGDKVCFASNRCARKGSERPATA